MKLVTQDLVLSREKHHIRFPDLLINGGQQVLLLGPSGSGKTSFLSILAGLLKPTGGNVTVDGTDLFALSARNRDAFRGRHFGFIFQRLHLLPSLNVRDNVMLPQRVGQGGKDAAKADGLLQLLGLGGKEARRPYSLSEGERQRAAIARAVIARPSIILADEPTSALDDKNANIIMDLIESCTRESNASLIVATHDARIKNRFTDIIHLAERSVS